MFVKAMASYCFNMYVDHHHPGALLLKVFIQALSLDNSVPERSTGIVSADLEHSGLLKILTLTCLVTLACFHLLTESVPNCCPCCARAAAPMPPASCPIPDWTQPPLNNGRRCR
jgi:hypothetical protein